MDNSPWNMVWYYSQDVLYAAGMNKLNLNLAIFAVRMWSTIEYIIQQIIACHSILEIPCMIHSKMAEYSGCLPFYNYFHFTGLALQNKNRAYYLINYNGSYIAKTYLIFSLTVLMESKAALSFSYPVAIVTLLRLLFLDFKGRK